MKIYVDDKSNTFSDKMINFNCKTFILFIIINLSLLYTFRDETLFLIEKAIINEKITFVQQRKIYNLGDNLCRHLN